MDRKPTFSISIVNRRRSPGIRLKETTLPTNFSPVPYSTERMFPTVIFFFLFSCVLLLYRYYRPFQAKSLEFFKYNFVPKENYFVAWHLLYVKTGNKDQNTERKSLCGKYLRKIFGQKFAVTPYTVRVYVKFFVQCTEDHPSAKGDTSSPHAIIAAYCEARACTRSEEPGFPTRMII